MVATPYKIAMRVVNSANQQRSIPLTASDVNAAFWLFPSGGSELQLSSLPCTISDIIYTSAGVDTSSVSLFVNGIDSGIKIFNGANLGTVYDRQVKSAPISIPAGALVRFVQNT